MSYSFNITPQINEYLKEEDIKEVKLLVNYITDFGEISTLNTQKICYGNIKKFVPKLIELFLSLHDKKYFKEFMYAFLYGLDFVNLPKCPICGNYLPLRNWVKGFQKTCSKRCQAAYFKLNTEAHDKIGKTRKLSQANTHKWVYDYKHIYKNNYYIFYNYCDHGDLKIYNRKAHDIHDLGEATLCYKCNEKIFNSFNPTEDDIQNMLGMINEFLFKNKNAVNHDYWITYYPKLLKTMYVYANRCFNKPYNKVDLPEIYYICKNKLNKLPKCTVCGNDVTKFYPSFREYALRCNEHLYTPITESSDEKEIKKFLNQNNIEYIEHDRSVLKGQEIDIYIPSFNFGIEFNGCYWHCEDCKPDIVYHKNKKITATDNDTNLLFIWQDVWQKKKEVCKDLIKRRCGIIEKEIDYTTINEISDKIEIKEFIKNNSLYPYHENSIYIGAYLNNELIATIELKKQNTKLIIQHYTEKVGVLVNNGIKDIFNYTQAVFPNYSYIANVYNDNEELEPFINLGFNNVEIQDHYTYLNCMVRYEAPITENDFKCWDSGITILEYEKK